MYEVFGNKNGCICSLLLFSNDYCLPVTVPFKKTWQKWVYVIEKDVRKCMLILPNFVGGPIGAFDTKFMTKYLEKIGNRTHTHTVCYTHDFFNLEYKKLV